MSKTAAGIFEVSMSPLDTSFDGAPPRVKIDKVYQGALEGTGQGEMLTHRSEVEGSAGYVALERVEGTLEGRAGSFVLQHFGLMSKQGGQELRIEIVPDSGTESLKGISGTMEITIDDEGHHYSLMYELGAA